MSSLLGENEILSRLTLIFSMLLRGVYDILKALSPRLDTVHQLRAYKQLEHNNYFLPLKQNTPKIKLQMRPNFMKQQLDAVAQTSLGSINASSQERGQAVKRQWDEPNSSFEPTLPRKTTDECFSTKLFYFAQSLKCKTQMQSKRFINLHSSDGHNDSLENRFS